MQRASGLAVPTSSSSLFLFTRRLPDSSTCDAISANLERWLFRQKHQETDQVIHRAKVGQIQPGRGLCTRGHRQDDLVLGSFPLGLSDTEGIQKNEAQRAHDTTLPHSQRDMHLGDRSSERVANYVASAGVTCFQYHRQTFQFFGGIDCCPQAISWDGIKGLLQVEQKTCEKTTSATCLMAWASASLEHIFQDGRCVRKGVSRIDTGLHPLLLPAQVDERMPWTKPCQCD